ncbi:MAG TPA: rhodanese-like domain-containing protein [Candidatus Eisenbacteria bacterium]|nr:rhodanese-like domain-containing protein [Candidatus Eisenbacteria bacterium]
MNEKPVSPAQGRSHSGWWWIGIAIVLVAIALVWMPRRTANPVGQPPVAQAPATPQAAPGPVVTVAKAAELQTQGAFLVDVRQPEEWAEGHIQGSKLIPLDDLESRLAEVPRDRNVVVVCHSGNRSKHGRDILLRAGYPQVASMAGGLSAWEAEGRKTVKGM